MKKKWSDIVGNTGPKQNNEDLPKEESFSKLFVADLSIFCWFLCWGFIGDKVDSYFLSLFPIVLLISVIIFPFFGNVLSPLLTFKRIIIVNLLVFIPFICLVSANKNVILLRSCYSWLATKTMLTIGADPNFKDEYGYTPLIESVRHNNAGILKMLLSAGAEPHIRIKVSDGQEYSALDFACEWNRKLVTEILVNEGVRIENPQNETILKNCGELIKKQHNKELK